MDKVSEAISTIRKAAKLAQTYSGLPLYLGFSGGKDSLVVYDLARRAGVDFEAWFNPTTLDPAENIRYIRQHFPEVRFTKVRQSFFSLVRKKKMLPTMLVRYCCREYKEGHGVGRVCLMGVRRAESARRSGRKLVAVMKSNRTLVESDSLSPVTTMCYGGGREKITVRPILDWTDDEVWAYIKDNGLPVNPVYGHARRVGCLFCPMKSGAERRRDMEENPHLAARLLAAAEAVARPLFPDGATYIRWWLSGKSVEEFKREDMG